MKTRQFMLAGCTAALGLLAFGSATTQAYTLSFFNSPLPGNTASDKWSNFDNWTAPQYGVVFPGAAAWTGPAMTAPTSSQTAGQEAEFYKVSGNGYPANFGPGTHNFIYLATTGAPGTSTFRAFDDDPIANLKTVVFQVASGPGTANGSDFLTAPVLNYNGGTQQLAATPTSGGIRYAENGLDFQNNPGETYRERYWQFDLTGVVGTINKYEVVWSQPFNHTQIYSLQLNQGDTFAAVPEPASLGLLAVAGTSLAMRRRRAR